jgi:transforming growth factor-beta-induced protein
MIKDLSKFSFLLFLSLTLVMTSCDDDDDEEPTPTPSGPTQNIAELAVASPQFSILVEALTATGLVDAVAADGSMTVFAPNNDAFNEFFDQAGLTDDNGDGSRVDEAAAALGADAVSELLLYHVIGAEIPASAVTGKTYVNTSSTTSPDGDALSLLAEPANNTVLVNGGNGNNGADKGATVVAADIFATNGVIHEIDGVLELPSVVDHAIFNSDFSELVGAVVAADLVPTLEAADAITVFAPVNSAFEAIQSTVDGLTLEQLTSVLTYHVVGSQVRAEDINPGAVGTLNGQDITIGVAADDVTVTVTDANGGVSTVILTNVQGTNGVVHVIDTVLIPTL